jgi:hypothetical protein
MWNQIDSTIFNGRNPLIINNIKCHLFYVLWFFMNIFVEEKNPTTTFHAIYRLVGTYSSGLSEQLVVFSHISYIWGHVFHLKVFSSWLLCHLPCDKQLSFFLHLVCKANFASLWQMMHFIIWF